MNEDVNFLHQTMSETQLQSTSFSIWRYCPSIHKQWVLTM